MTAPPLRGPGTRRATPGRHRHSRAAGLDAKSREGRHEAGADSSQSGAGSRLGRFSSGPVRAAEQTRPWLGAPARLQSARRHRRRLEGPLAASHGHATLDDAPSEGRRGLAGVVSRAALAMAGSRRVPARGAGCGVGMPPGASLEACSAHPPGRPAGSVEGASGGRRSQACPRR